MTETVSFARNVLRQIDDKITATESAILGGSAQTFDDYRRLTGRLAGLKDARDVVVSTLGDEAQHLNLNRD